MIRILLRKVVCFLSASHGLAGVLPAILMFMTLGLSACGRETLEKGGGSVPPISQADIAAHAGDPSIQLIISWSVILLALLLQVFAFVAARRKLASVMESEIDVGGRMRLLDAIETYFDLPLYFGLLCTVMAFIVITLFPDAGLMFAYVSTGLGIIVSVFLRLRYLIPYRQSLIGLASDK